MRRGRVLGLPLMIVLSGAGSASAQDMVRDSTAIVFLGLVHRPPLDVERLIQEVRPGLSLASSDCVSLTASGCVLALRDSLGFAEAHARGAFSTQGPIHEWVLISVVEPERTH